MKISQNKLVKSAMQVGIPQKIFSIIIMVGLAISLVPMLALSFYNFPSNDDFSYGLFTSSAWQNTHSFCHVFLAAVQQVQDSYFNWQGSFSSIFLFALQPAIFGVQFYAFSTFILLGSFLLCTFYSLYQVLCKVLRFSRPAFCIISGCILLVQIQLVPRVSDAFYWYNGAMYYTFFYALLLLLAGLLIANTLRFSILKLVLCVLFAFFIGGGNYTTALLGTCCLAFGAILYFITTKKIHWSSVFSLAGMMIALIISILAPGNAVRRASTEGLPALQAILQSFIHTAKFAFEFLSLPFIAVMVVLGVVFWQHYRKINFRFRFPLGVVALLVCLFATQITPALYAMGYSGEERQINHYFYVFVLFSTLALFYCLGWVYQKTHNQHAEGTSLKIPVFILVLTSVLVLLGALQMDVMRFTVVKTTLPLVQGTAKQYALQMTQRQSLLENSNALQLQLPPLTVAVEALRTDGITTSEVDWVNVTVAKYYQKQSVVIQIPQP